MDNGFNSWLDNMMANDKTIIVAFCEQIVIFVLKNMHMTKLPCWFTGLERVKGSVTTAHSLCSWAEQLSDLGIMVCTFSLGMSCWV